MLRYFLEYQWYVDFAVYSSFVYLFTEGYYCMVDPRKEANIGILWCLLTMIFSVYPFGNAGGREGGRVAPSAFPNGHARYGLLYSVMA